MKTKATISKVKQRQVAKRKTFGGQGSFAPKRRKDNRSFVERTAAKKASLMKAISNSLSDQVGLLIDPMLRFKIERCIYELDRLPRTEFVNLGVTADELDDLITAALNVLEGQRARTAAAFVDKAELYDRLERMQVGLIGVYDRFSSGLEAEAEIELDKLVRTYVYLTRTHSKFGLPLSVDMVDLSDPWERLKSQRPACHSGGWRG